tara:strand:+ start:313 stop:501 length:189 start_codon:yes stop_codon:yes gene_type:complete
MDRSNYNYRQFVETYRNDIGYIISQIKTGSKIKGYKINEEEKLFKNLIYTIYIHSDKQKLKY